MPKHTHEKQPLLAGNKPVGGGILTLEECKKRILEADNKAQMVSALRQAIRTLPMETREILMEDFNKYNNSTRLSNGNHTVYFFYCDVMSDYQKDKGIVKAVRFNTIL